MANKIEQIPDNYSEHFKNVCKEVSGFMFYQKEGRVVKVDGNTCYVYGKYDAIRPSEIIKDIKTTKEYKLNKYLKTIQHFLYCYISGIDKFEYIIVEWEKYMDSRKVRL